MLDRFYHYCSTLGPVGYLPKVPGTWASLATVCLVPFCFLPLPVLIRLGIVLLVFFLGGFTAGRSEKLLGMTDPGLVVVDELLGQLITFLPFAALNIWELPAGFLLFRFFDILKPWPIRASENWLPGGYGVMLDDLLAGLFACLCLGIIRWLVVL